jgi:hypothetical protein
MSVRCDRILKKGCLWDVRCERPSAYVSYSDGKYYCFTCLEELDPTYISSHHSRVQTHKNKLAQERIANMYGPKAPPVLVINDDKSDESIL